MLSGMARALTLSAVVLLLLASGEVSADRAGQKALQIDRLVEKFLQPRDGVTVPALSIAVGADGELKVAKGYGNARAGQPAGAGTVYHIGSLSKQFTAAAVLHMLESGARAPLSQRPLMLDTPMREVFDGVEKWSTEDEPPVTVRSLLTMTSNLPNFTVHPPREADPWGAIAKPKLLAELKRLPPHGWPNTFEYSNTGYFLLARAMEAALDAGGVHMSAREYMRANIVERAHLKQTGFVGDYAPGSEIAEAHYRRRPAFAEPHWLDGCGDMASNALDLFAWNKALMEERVIGAGAIRLMLSDAARVDPVTYYGMGWFISHEGEWDSYHHSGSVPGYTSYNAILRHKISGRWISVTLLTNSDGVEGIDRLADEIFDVVRGD